MAVCFIQGNAFLGMEGEKSLTVLLLIIVLRRNVSNKINYFRTVLIFFQTKYVRFSGLADKMQDSPF